MPSNPQPPVSPRGRADSLVRVSDQLDRLIADERLGTRSQREYDDREERAQAIAAALIAVYRKSVTTTVHVKPGKRGGLWVY